MHILNIAGYKFTPLKALQTLRSAFLEQCTRLCLKGTILLSEEGININIAGTADTIEQFKSYLKSDTNFADISFRESYSEAQPFKRLKIKLKNEIITLRQKKADPISKRAASITPEILQQWLDEKRDITLLDVRNDYEIQFGTFKNAVNLHLENFCDFPKKVPVVNSDKPVVMFCTGGIRCEKAALYMLEQGHTDIYQLEGGILNYFAKTNGTHYDGECFVFDERVSVDKKLEKNNKEPGGF